MRNCATIYSYSILQIYCMHKHTFHNLGKIGVLSWVILLIVQAVTYATGTQKQLQNDSIYASANTQSLSQVGVAIGTGIGVRFDTGAFEQATAYGESGELWETPEESREIRSTMISQNMVIIKEYLALLQTDVLELLNTSDNRRNTLNTLISQLELRFRNASTSQTNLQNQKNLLVADTNSVKGGVDRVKNKLSSDFTGNKANAVLNDVDEYLELKSQERENFVDVVFINQFLTQYNFLNAYNKNLLDTLINNKEALITESFVVIPDSGDEFLKEFNLLYEEQEFKALSQ